MGSGEVHSGFGQRRAGRQPARAGLTWRGRGALALLALHLGLLFLPPLPPVSKGSLWHFLVAAAVVALGALEVARAAPRLAAWWGGLDRDRRLLLSYGAAAGTMAAGLALRLLSPEIFQRFSLEQGLWEPLTLFLYVCAAVLLLRSARAAEPGSASHLAVAGTLFALVAAEEVDYLGVFAPLIGRVEGTYVGTPHDLARLWAEGITPPAIAAIVLLPALVASVVLWRRGHLRPARLRPLVRPPIVLRLASGAALVGMAMAEEAGLFGLTLGTPSPEELLECAGALLLAAAALELVSPNGRSAPVHRLPTRPERRRRGR